MPVTPLPHTSAPAVVGSFDSNRLPIDKIIVHTMDGTFEGTRSWFANKNRKSLTSAHYGVAFDGRIDCYVDEGHTAYHAGNYTINTRSIGIEFEDKGEPNNPRPDKLYQTGAALIADIANRYSIPIDREHIEPHRKYNAQKTCPGSLDVDRLITLATQSKADVEQHSGSVNLPNSLFTFLVTTSRNFKEVATLFGYTTNEAINDPKLGETLALEISRLQFERDYWEKQALQSSTQSKPLLTELFENKPDLITQSVPVLNKEDERKIVIEHGKSLLQKDLNRVITKLVSIFWT